MRHTDIPQLLPGTLYMLILRTLSRGPLHGYAIARRIADSSEEGLQIDRRHACFPLRARKAL